MSSRIGWCAVGFAALIVSTNAGCYYDQLLQEQRARKVLEEQLARAKDDLHDCESMREVLNNKIDSMNGQLAAYKQTIDSLTAENESNRAKLAEALSALEKMAGRDLQSPVVITQQLPPALDKALRELQEKYPNLLEYDASKGAVRWKSDLLFPLGSDDLGKDVGQALKDFADIVNSPAAEGFDVIIVGHTCTTPIRRPETLREHKTNWHLSAHRAISVMNALKGNGVADTKMGVMGYGEWRPIAPNDTDENKARNRRVEIFLVKSDKVASVGGGGGSAGLYEAPDGTRFVKPAGTGAQARPQTGPSHGGAGPCACSCSRPGARAGCGGGLAVVVHPYRRDSHQEHPRAVGIPRLTCRRGIPTALFFVRTVRSARGCGCAAGRCDHGRRMSSRPVLFSTVMP